jgi:hypothetical protein
MPLAAVRPPGKVAAITHRGIAVIEKLKALKELTPFTVAVVVLTAAQVWLFDWIYDGAVEIETGLVLLFGLVAFVLCLIGRALLRRIGAKGRR